jgi:hypothetical protein
MVSRDMDDALLRVREMQIPPERHAIEFGHVIQEVAEQGAQASCRSVGFDFATKLFLTKGIFDRSKLSDALEVLHGESMRELRCDLPDLQKILQNECLPALSSLITAGLLEHKHFEALKGLI